MPIRHDLTAITFDFGQTLADLDATFLAARLLERFGISVDATVVESHVEAAFDAYGRAIAAGHGGHPWKFFMTVLLQRSGVQDEARARAVDWLWGEQPRRNLWRRPVPGMIDLARRCKAEGLRVGIISNSEGRLHELVSELRYDGVFEIVVDSGKLGIEKPDRRIFDHALHQFGVLAHQTIHIGDSWVADVEGATRAGMKAAWFRGDPKRAGAIPVASSAPSLAEYLFGG